ncbi:MAG: transposase [Desulfobacterales bacterium]|nr:transposase [Desulfobacterales bacterium]
MFAAVNQTLQAFAKDLQWPLEGQLGFILVLHTWSQTLMDHFHLHCLVPAGAFSPGGQTVRQVLDFYRQGKCTVKSTTWTQFVEHIRLPGTLKIRFSISLLQQYDHRNCMTAMKFRQKHRWFKTAHLLCASFYRDFICSHSGLQDWHARCCAENRK